MISPEFCWNQSFRQNYAGFSLEFGIWRNFAGRPENLAEFRKSRWRKKQIKQESNKNQGYFLKISNLLEIDTKNEGFHKKQESKKNQQQIKGILAEIWLLVGI